MIKNLRIVFFGTSDFAVTSLNLLVKHKFNIVGLVTNPDKKAGRGLKLKKSPIKLFTEKISIPILQPKNLKSTNFLQKLKTWKADLQIVIAFKILSLEVWSMPPLGTINLHPSYLPQYRGAAPINWAIINGEKQTGVTTIKIGKGIDTGHILLQEKVDISCDETMGSLHQKLEIKGAHLLIKTIHAIQFNKIKPIPQNHFIKGSTILKKAPKVTKQHCIIDWNNNINSIYNQIRGLSPHPATWTLLQDKNKKRWRLKIFQAEKILKTHTFENAHIVSDNKSYIHITVKGGLINIISLQIEGKKRLPVKEFLNGVDISLYKIKT